MTQSKVLLCGYMGSGKSTTGKLLANQLQIQHVDLDEYISALEQQDIASIIREKGEMHFRKMESRYFNQLMDSPETFVLSLGGGTPVYAGNHYRLRENGVISFYLRASIPELITRLAAMPGDRPLLDGLSGIDLEEFIGKHLLERQTYYFAATHTIAVDGKSSEQITSEIIGLCQ
ncbi:MAG: shikimate kinase [Chitinophagaceae bacterium]|nr:MAG: shikimate kinase [Chitinophagaceae bacterium]